MASIKPQKTTEKEKKSNQTISKVLATMNIVKYAMVLPAASLALVQIFEKVKSFPGSHQTLYQNSKPVQQFKHESAQTNQNIFAIIILLGG